MNTLRLLAALLLLVGPASALTHRVQGAVTAVDREAKSFTFTDHRGNVTQFRIGDDLKIEKEGGASATFEDLQPGDKVALVYKGKDRLESLKILPPREAEAPFGQGTPSETD